MPFKNIDVPNVSDILQTDAHKSINNKSSKPEHEGKLNPSKVKISV